MVDNNCLFAMVNKVFVFCFFAFFLFACEESQKIRTDGIYAFDYVFDEDGMGGPEDDYDDDDYTQEEGDGHDFQLTGIIETCRHCMGYGIVQDGLYGVAQYCKFCGGQRVVDAAVNQLPDDFFERMTEQGGRTASDYETNKEQIVAEIERLEEDIAQMEHQLEYIEGSIQTNYLRQQIIETRYEIKRLQRMLNQ